MVNGIMNFEFQDNCVEFLIDKTSDPASRQIITINFGFVRDINEDLFINNTEYHEDMSHDSWRPLSDLL